MQDPEKADSTSRSTKRNSQNGHQDLDDDELEDLSPEEEEEKPVPQRASRPAYKKEQAKREAEEDAYDKEQATPRSGNGFAIALITGIVAGALIALLNIVLAYLNASTYNSAALAAKNTANSYAGIIIGLWCLNIAISLLVCFFVGFIMGKTRSERRPGFYAGATAGIVMYIGSFVVNYIPHYPGHINSNSTASAGNIATGLITALAVLLIQGFIGGLFGLWGAWTATRNHPAYAEE